MKEENTIRLSDGKQLCYAEYGNPDGIPVLLFHGNPGSRISWGLYPESPFLENIRIIAPDRPGYGKTEYKRHALENWPDDVKELCDHLGIKKFHLFAPSGGGPYALACAWKIPERLLSVGLFGSVGPYSTESVKGVNKPLQVLWRIANPLFGLVKLQNRIIARVAKTDPLKLAKSFSNMELSDNDQRIAQKPDIQTVFEKVFPESYLQHGIGSAYDVTIPKNWKTPLDQIQTKITIWQAEEDCLTGKMAEELDRKLPKSELIRIYHAGHLWIMENIKQVLEQLINESKE